MIYLQIDTKSVRFLSLRKSLLGQYETVFFGKEYHTELLTQGTVANVDYIASAIKEALQESFGKKSHEKEVTLIIPAASFQFLRFDVPGDIAASAVASFVKDKAQSSLIPSTEDYYADFVSLQSGAQRIINYYALDATVVSAFRESLSLVDLKLTAVVPETIAYFTLFDKTLRKEKKENILYAVLEKTSIRGYVYDTFGLLNKSRWDVALETDTNTESVFKEKAQSLEKEGIKLNRLVLSGSASDSIRQDTFTKHIGVWTNPLKRIIANFYQDSMKLLIHSLKKPFPILTYDGPFGAFVFERTHKHFCILKNRIGQQRRQAFSLSLPIMPAKEFFIFAASFVLSFGLFFLISKLNIGVPTFPKILQSPTETPTPKPSFTPTPTITAKREDLKIKVLNGSGVSGKATEMKSILVKAGYTGEILTGNADDFDYEITEIKVKKTMSGAAGMIKKDLGEYVSPVKESVLAETEAADVVIIIGSDFK